MPALSRLPRTPAIDRATYRATTLDDATVATAVEFQETTGHYIITRR
ncbi:MULTISPECIES: hypothetical protein [Nocardia]|nr:MULTISPECIES: hypothetical protein [Nocardia]MBF6348789.1 hypothetical protein [Nocardia flavorosea]